MILLLKKKGASILPGAPSFLIYSVIYFTSIAAEYLAPNLSVAQI
jgi:hypothetical protein